ncbi:WD repeat protein [Aspergillus sclerotialis]|uniref:WD repeat protein n=1 Tax=Aspergillus sclerotialis TaxID=2070753 RepID=A0A3A2ZNL6_9EURO|nr:WD repeat protein [Aspergillus sclerotialis]
MAEKRLDLVPLVQSSGPDWKFDFDRENLWRLPGAHGEEVVRSVYLDEQSKSVFTGGEDGFVRAWKPVDEKEGEPQSEGASTKSKKQKKKDRFKPY